MFRAVFLDVDDTLLDFNACAAEAMRQGLQLRGEEYHDEMFPVFLQINRGFWRDIESGAMSRAEFAAKRWNTVFAALGLSHLDGPAFEKDFKRILMDCAVPIPHALEIVQQLSHRVPLYVATNGPQVQQETRLSHAGMLPYIRQVFTSETIGAEKPSRAFFTACFARLPGIAPEETLFVGDSLTADIAGGAAFGMTTCWYNPRQLPVIPEITPRHIITDLRQLPVLL